MILSGNMVRLPIYKDFLSFWAPSGVSPCLQLLLKKPTLQSLYLELYLPASGEDLEVLGLSNPILCAGTYSLFILHFWLLFPTSQLWRCGAEDFWNLLYIWQKEATKWGLLVWLLFQAAFQSEAWTPEGSSRRRTNIRCCPVVHWIKSPRTFWWQYDTVFKIAGHLESKFGFRKQR